VAELKYRFDDQLWTIKQLSAGWMVRRESATIGGPYPSESAARQNLFVFMREYAAKIQSDALVTFKHAARLECQLGTDHGIGLANLKVMR
jgi:hypothetical protein